MKSMILVLSDEEKILGHLDSMRKYQKKCLATDPEFKEKLYMANSKNQKNLILILTFSFLWADLVK